MDLCPFGHSSHTTISSTVHRKPTHTDLYLQWDSHHTIAAKYSVVNTLHHRSRAVCSNQQILKEEEDHLQKVLLANKYPIWVLNRVKMKIKKPSKQINLTSGNKKHYMVLPCVKGLSESLKMYAENLAYKYIAKEATPSSLLMASRDKDPITKSGIIYKFKCNRMECDDEYIRESSGTFGERFKEHLRALPQYMTITTSQVIVPPLIISVLQGGRTRASSEISKKQYT